MIHKLLSTAFLLLLFNINLQSQTKTKVILNNDQFEVSFVYTIISDLESDYRVKILDLKNGKKEVSVKNHRKVFGRKSFKADVSLLKKGRYLFQVLDKESNVIFNKIIKKSK